uniref:Sorting nexin 14 n=2 Tax=Homo sapiens TaxID=9606 RepID=A0A804HHZ6_HUMAN
MVPWVRTMGQKLKQRLRLDVGREICRQYPLFCFLLLCLSAASLLLNSS